MLNKLRARHELHTVSMRANEQMLLYIDRVQDFNIVLKGMDVGIEGKEVAMTIPNELPSKFQNVITTLNALDGNTKCSRSSTVNSLFLQEEPPREMRLNFFIVSPNWFHWFILVFFVWNQYFALYTSVEVTQKIETGININCNGRWA